MYCTIVGLYVSHTLWYVDGAPDGRYETGFSILAKKKKKEKEKRHIVKVSHVVQYNLKYRPSAYFVANDGKSRLVHCQHHSLFFLMLKVCILTILINQLELIETRIAISVCRSNAGDAVLSPLARGGAVAVGCSAWPELRGEGK